MTAHAMMGEKEKCLELGMNDYVSKPIKETVLYNVIAKYAQQLPEANGNGSGVNLDIFMNCQATTQILSKRY